MAGKAMDKLYKFDENGKVVEVLVPTGIGFIGLYAGPEPPEGYLYCDGSAIGRETYSELFEAIGTLYGAGDGAETFNLPDARGIFFRGDGGENNAAMGVRQGDAIRNITGSYMIRPTWNTDRNQPGKEIGNGQEVVAWNSPGGLFYAEYRSTTAGGCIVSDDHESTFITMTFDAGNKVPTAAENRPINLAMKPCIRYV